MKEKHRITVVQQVGCGALSVEEGAKVLSCSVRTVFRLCERLRVFGLEGLVHGNKGKKSSRKTEADVVERVLGLVRGKYAGINDTHLRELLDERERIELGRETLRGLLRAAGIKPKRQRRRSPYRSRRERKPAMGMMLQVDASVHDWLEGRGPRLTLVGAKDDATGHMWAHFAVAETTWSYLDLMKVVIASHGVPLSLYSDRHTIFHTPREPTIVEQLKDIQPLTQFGRAMDELGCTIIKAWSPQAKGRIERVWGTLQDRLVVELRLAGVTTMEQANDHLKSFLVRHNNQFVIPARDAKAVFRSAPPQTALMRILCCKEVRMVNKDHTVSVDGIVLQIPPSRKFRSIAGKRVEVLQLADGALEIVCGRLTVATFSKGAISRILNQTKNVRTDWKKAA
jgi:transposase